MSFRNFITSTIDSIFAPASVNDANSNDRTGESREQSVEWHNAYGTAADYQIPAESVNVNYSNDWSEVDSANHWSDSDYYGSSDCGSSW